MRNIRTMKPLIEDTVFALKNNCKQKQPRCGVFTGFVNIDEFTGGFQKSTLNIIASRPSMGKSAFVETMALNMTLKDGLSVLYFSIDASEFQLTIRLLSNLTGLWLRDVKTGNLSPEKWNILADKAKELETAKLFVDTTGNIDIKDLCETARKECEKNQIDVIIIDFIQLITSSDFRTINNREQEVSYIARILKGLSKELDIPIFAVSELNRRYTEKGYESVRAPQLVDLRDTGTLEDVADMVMFVYRPEVLGILTDNDGNPTSGMADMIVAKNKYGDRGVIRMRYDESICRFRDYDENYFDMSDISTGDTFDI